MRRVFLLVFLMLSAPLVPLTNADYSPYSGPYRMIVTPNSDGTLVNLTDTSFEVPANATILDAWVNVSTDANGDGGTGQHWVANSPARNFSTGTLDQTSLDVFDHEITLGVNQSVGRIDDLETLSLRFQHYTPNDAANIWRMANASQFNGPFAMNYSAREAAGGFIPSLATDGFLVAATLPEDPLPAGTHAWLTSDATPIPSRSNEWRITFNHWYHLHAVNSSTGSSGAWLEVSLDGGYTWTYVEPIGGYDWNVSTSAPVPNGAQGAGFGVFGGHDASGWVNSTFDISHLNTTNATSMMHRFVVWTDPTGQVDRPGWYLDEVTISNRGDTPGSWFHGSLIGEYAGDAHSYLVIPLQMDMNGTSGAWMLRYWSDFDLEGGSWDNYHVHISSDNLSYHRLSPAGGIPGPYGLTIGTQTIMEDSQGWVEIAHPFPSSFTVPSNGSVYVRFEVETDIMPSSGYGNILDAPEGVFIDDLSITQTVNGQTFTRWSENLTTEANATHSLAAGGSYDQWQHLTNWGNNGPWESTWSFEGAPPIADGWLIHTDYGQRWAFGEVSNSSGWGPGAWPSGNTGVAMGLTNRHSPTTWTHLISPTYHIPQGASARIAFDHFICTESGWDGGALYTSVDNGTSWQHFGANIPDFYDQQHYNNYQSPFYGQWAWDGSTKKGGCQTNKTFEHMEADVSSFGGQDVMLRFSFFSDPFIEMDGWYIDQVGIVVDWFESEGTWTSQLLTGNEFGFSPSLDIDASIPLGTWITTSIMDANGTLLHEGEYIPDNATFPVLFAGDSYRIQLRFGTNNHELTPRVHGLHQGAIRILNSADGTNGWELPNSVQHDRLVGNVTNPTLLTQRIEGSTTYGDAPLEAVTIVAEAAGALFEIRDGQGMIIASGSLTNRTIQLPYSAVNIRPIIDLQPGGWVRYASFTGHLGLAMNNGSLDIGGDGSIDWSWSYETDGAFGWYDGSHLLNQSSQWVSPGTMLDQGMALGATANITWTWANGIHDSMEEGELRILEYPWTSIQNQSDSSNFEFMPLAISWESTISISDLGPSLREIQAFAINGTGPAQIISGDVHIPLTLSADQGGVQLSGGITHAQRIVNAVTSVPSGTMVPDQYVTIITEHSHLFDISLLDAIDLRMQTSGGNHLEMRVEDIWGTQMHQQMTGHTNMELIDANITLIDSDSIQVEWNLRTKWTFDDQDSIRILAEAVELDGFTLGPAHAFIGGSNHQAMENDLEVVSWEVRDSTGRLLSNTWDARYPFHAAVGTTIDVTGVVRFEGQNGIHPAIDAFRVALEIEDSNGTSQAIGMSTTNGGWSASIDLPTSSGNVTVSPWIVDIGPPGVSVYGAEDASGGSISVEIRLDSEAPTLGPLMIHTPEGGRQANGNVLSPDQILPLWVEVHDDELLLSFIDLRCWLEAFDDIDGDGVPDEGEYGISSQFIGGIPRGTFRVDFPAINLQGMGEGDRVSCYIEGGDFAGFDFIGGGGPGFESDLATMTIQTQSPTQISLASIDLNRHDDISLLQGIRHTFSFSLIDSNGLESIDSIDLSLTGDDQGLLHYDPLTGEYSSPESSHVVPLGVRIDDMGSHAYAIEFDFAIDLSAPSTWQQGTWLPDLIITEDGEIVSTSTQNLEHLSWALDHRLMWVVDDAIDLTAPAMPMFDGRLNLQPGDTMAMSASILHRETGQPLDINFQMGAMANISIEGGTQNVWTNVSMNGSGFNTQFEMNEQIWPGPTATIVANLQNIQNLNTSLPQLSFEVAIDNVAPQLEFQTTSLIQLQSNHLTNQLVSFSVQDAGGMGGEVLELHWTYRRFGVDIPGTQASIEMTLGAHSSGQWLYSDYVDLTPSVELEPGDTILVWVEGSDLAGNHLEGPGTEESPRAPALEVMHFSPGLVSIWVEPLRPEVGDMVRVDARITNLGNLEGSIDIGLWAWESQANGPDQRIRLNDRNFTLNPSESVLVIFEFEAWREGDLQVYLVLNQDEDTKQSVNIPPIREQGASQSFMQRVFGDGPIIIGLVMIFFTGLGFVGAILWIGRNEDDEWEDEDEIIEDEDDWPEPPPTFPDESPPPVPKDLLDISEEEE